MDCLGVSLVLASIRTCWVSCARAGEQTSGEGVGEEGLRVLLEPHLSRKLGEIIFCEHIYSMSITTFH